jgi:photosystem II stability/assembly factor-like uncharacterized protein
VNQKLFRAGICCLSLFFGINVLPAQDTAFTYQGQLASGGSPANGSYDLRFVIYDAVTNGNAVTAPLTNSTVAVNNGLFTTMLDFGTNVFTGTNYWLDISVRAAGTSQFTTLSPRQPLTSVPYAIFANTASNLLGFLSAAQLSGALPSAQLSGMYSGTVAFSNGGNSFQGTFTGNGSSLSNLDASQLSSGTVADARLSPNVPLLNGNQTFSGQNSFTNFDNSFRGSFFGNGLVGWIPTNATAFQATIDTGYLLTNSQLVTVTLPAAARVGDIVRISGPGAGGWQIAQNTNQFVLGNFVGFTKSFWSLGGASTTLHWNSIAASSDGTKLAAVASGSGGGVYTSTDSGATWSGPFGNTSASWRAIASSADGTRLAAVITGGSIYTNSGTTWNAVAGTSGLQWDAIASSADGSKLIVAANGGGVYVSSNYGQTWTSVRGSANWISVASSADGSKMIAAISGGGIDGNSSGSWAAETGSPASGKWASVASSADGSRLVAVSDGGGIYTSGDSGADWTEQTNAPNANWIAVASSADGSKLAAAITNNGGIYLSSNYGRTWALQTNAPTEDWSAIVSSADGSKLAATVNNATSGGIFLSQSSLQTSTTPGTAGYIIGGQGSAVELQYIGNNEWMPVSSAGTIWAY